MRYVLRPYARIHTSCRQLRSKLIKMQKKCIISGWTNPVELQMAHIIPRAIAKNIGFKKANTDSNCFLLSNCLHAMFDSFEWTFDIFSFLDTTNVSESDSDSDSDSDLEFKSSILIHKPPKPGRSSLSGCANNIYSIPIRYYPSLYAHYYVYLRLHYTTDTDPQTCFDRCIRTPIFRRLEEIRTTTEMRNYLLELREIGDDEDINCSVILEHHGSLESFHVLRHLWSWQNRLWFPGSEIPCKMRLQYEDHIEELSDPSYRPKRNL